MKFAATTTEDGEIVTVTADGKRLGEGDVDCRMLHILPKFFAPACALPHLNKDEIDLKITSTLGEVTPAGGVAMRQPYPNRRYFVAGSNEMRNGWVIRLPEGVSEFDLQFEWTFYRAWQWMDVDDWEVRHLIHVTLLPGDKRLYTMDANCWPRLADPKAFSRTAISLAGHHEDDASLREGRDIIRISGLHYPEEPDYTVGYYIEERLAIPPVAYEQAWSLNAFEEEHLHEVEQSASFADGGNAIHQQNASVEMPADVFLNAVRLAGEIPFDKDSTFGRLVDGQPGGCEAHPAMLALHAWWKENRPDKDGLKVGFAMPWVRVRDDGEYWSGYHETPNVGVSDFAGCKLAAARVGDLILILFHASWEHFTYDEHGTSIRLTDGTPFSSIGVGKEEVLSGEHDEAWYSLEALRSFPDRFPAAYAALREATQVVTA